MGNKNPWIILKKSFSKTSYSIVKLLCWPCLDKSDQSECLSEETQTDPGASILDFYFENNEFGSFIRVETYRRNSFADTEDELIFFNDSDKLSDLVLSVFGSVYKPRILNQAELPVYNGVSSMDIQAYFGTKSNLIKLLTGKMPISALVRTEIDEYNKRIDKPLRHGNFNISIAYNNLQTMYFSFTGFVQSEQNIYNISDDTVLHVMEVYLPPVETNLNPYSFELPQVAAYPIKIEYRQKNIFDLFSEFGPYIGKTELGEKEDKITINYKYLGTGIIDEIETINETYCPFYIDQVYLLSSTTRYIPCIVYKLTESGQPIIEIKETSKYVYNKPIDDEKSSDELYKLLKGKTYVIDKILKRVYQNFIEIDIRTYLEYIDPSLTINPYFEEIKRMKEYPFNLKLFDSVYYSMPLTSAPNSQIPILDRYLSSFKVKKHYEGEGHIIRITGGDSSMFYKTFLVMGKNIIDFYSFCKLNLVTSAIKIPYTIVTDRESGGSDEVIIKHKLHDTDLFSVTTGSYVRKFQVDELGFLTVRRAVSPSTAIVKENLAIDIWPKAKVTFVYDSRGENIEDPDRISKISGSVVSVNVSNLYFKSVDGFRDFCQNYLNSIANSGGKTISGNGKLPDIVLDDFIDINSINLDYVGPSQSVSGI